MKICQKSSRGITLVALVITIVILLVLAGIAIATLGGENGLLTRAKQAKQAQTEADMKEKLTLSIQDLQVEKLGDATLDDITQEWIDTKINDYSCTVKNDLSISGKRVIMEKNGIICKFLIDEKLNITQIEESAGATLEYEVTSRDGDNVHALVTVKDKENGLKQIEYQDGTILYFNGEDEWAKDCLITLGVEYKVKITSKDGQVKEETILITDYYHKIIKNLGEGISIDNVAVKAAYNKPYQATVSSENDYIMSELEVTMGGQPVIVDASTGVINIEKVTGDIQIKATTRKIEIQSTDPYIGTSNTEKDSTKSAKPDTQEKGTTTLYINFNAVLEENNCSIEPQLPFAIKSNGKYIFTATGTYQGKTITKEIEVSVNQFKLAKNLVEYDAGEWSLTEIQELQTSKLYDINASHTINDIFKLDNDSGLDFTFGGFTYKGDTNSENQTAINSGNVITSRNKSVNPQSGYGTQKYDGWQILEIKDKDGNIIKNESQIENAITNKGDNKIYVTKLVHAGCPENFVYRCTTSNDAFRVEYLLSGGTKRTEYNKLSSGTTINPRTWDMYRDEKLNDAGYIKAVHILQYEEAIEITGNRNSTTGIRTTGGSYWLEQADGNDSCHYAVQSNGYVECNSIGNQYGFYEAYCLGIRPVIELNDGVYIASGEGIGDNPYVLGKD